MAELSFITCPCIIRKKGLEALFASRTISGQPEQEIALFFCDCRWYAFCGAHQMGFTRITAAGDATLISLDCICF
jgi:hypothetical protein